MTTATGRAIVDYVEILTLVVVKMIEHRGITTMDKLREQRDDLIGKPGFNPRTMMLVDRALEEDSKMPDVTTEDLTTYRVIARSGVEPWPGLNPRTVFDDDKLAELADSIRQRSLLEPLVVHDLLAPQPEHRPEVAAAIKNAIGRGITHWVVAGERRFRAADLAGLDQLPAVVGVYTEPDALDVALIENLQRVDMSALDEARAFARRLEAGDTTAAEIAERIGKSPSYVSNHMRLLQLPSTILSLIDEGVLMPSHARDFLLPFANIPAKKWGKLCSEVAKRIRDDREGLFGEGQVSSRDIRETVGEIAEQLSKSLEKSRHYPSSKDPLFDPKLHENCGCGGPAFTYGWDEKKTVRCFDEKWWDAAQAEAQDKAKQRERKRAEKAAKLAAQGGAKREYESISDAQKEHGYDVTTIGDENGEFGFAHIYDLEKIPAEKLVFAKVNHGALVLLCTDRRAANKASVQKERAELIAERRRERAQQQLAEASTKPLTQAQVLRAVITELAGGGYASRFRQMLIGLGLSAGENSYGPIDISAATDAEVIAWGKLFATKIEGGDFDRIQEDPIEKKVDRELRKKYAPALRAMFAARENGAAASSGNGAAPEAAPATNGKKPKRKGGRKLEAATAARAGDAVVSGAAAAAQRAAEAVRMSGIFNR